MTESAHEASLEDLMLQSVSIPDSQPSLACCCGRPSCAYLSHNNAALDGLEKDLRTAAQLGQALLIRHEAYMAEAEKTRLDMGTRIEGLETDKKKLEADNAKTIEENRALLNQLEDLNTQVVDSENQVKSFEASLQSTQYELRRLEGLAQRTHELELQIALLEQEQIELQTTVATTAAEERSAIHRWKKAERGLREVEEQLERIEREAIEERQKHVEVVGRMERQRTVEKELQSAAGRLKGAAAATSFGQGKGSSNVVSHFVKDILQDNANLQMGIVELREMLMNSNEEVQTLREQLVMHQPVYMDNENAGGAQNLKAELTTKEPQIIAPELHIHHHYHAPVKKEDIRKPKKKRNVINSALFTPPIGPQSLRMSRGIQMRPTPLSTTTTILDQTAVSIPPPMTPNKRWSAQSVQTVSDFAPSSAPSSPHSAFRSSAIFDQIDQALDSSRPTSPGSSVDPLSPEFRPYHQKRGSEHSTRSFTVPAAFQLNNVIQEEEDGDIENLPELELTPREDKESPGETEPSVPSVDSDDGNDIDPSFDPFSFQPSLRRSTSHESILSISGIDIHTLKSRPSQLTITASGRGLRLRPSLSQFNPIISFTSNEPVLSSSLTIARPTLSRNGQNSTSYLRSSMGMAERPVSRSSNSSGESQGLARKASGWVWNRWGVAPTPTAATNLDVAVRKAPQVPKPRSSTPMPSIDPLKAFMGRTPGVNQIGPIPGLRKPPKTPSKVMPERVDQDALKEVLME